MKIKPVQKPGWHEQSERFRAYHPNKFLPNKSSQKELSIKDALYTVNLFWVNDNGIRDDSKLALKTYYKDGKSIIYEGIRFTHVSIEFKI